MTHKELIDAVTQLEEEAATTTRQYRIAEVDRISGAYIAATGRVPRADLLERMSNVILHEELTDSHPDKMSRQITPDMTEDERKVHEYPIMSERMYNVRTRGDQRKKRKTGVTMKEVPLKQARNIGADGNNYNMPVRRVKK